MKDTDTTKTRSQLVAAEVAALLRARNPLLWVVTREEARVERYVYEAAASASYETRFWDVAQGVTDFSGKKVDLGSVDPVDTLNAVNAAAKSGRGGRALWVFRDLPPWLGGPAGLGTLRILRNLARYLPTVDRSNSQAILIISPSGDVPPELSAHATVIEWPLPDRKEIAAVLDAAIGNLPEDLKEKAAPNGVREAAIDAAIGLSEEEANACIAKSLVQLRRVDPATVAKEKKRVISKERVLEWYDPLPGGLDSVGGLEHLKAWLVQRKLAYSAKARAYGLPAPKGALLVGIPGCGKSMTAKAIATAWNIPLLRLDLGSLKSKFVGESEANLRKAFRTIEAIGRCVVWIDEIEKALQGATSGASDGGVSSDALGGILSWMQERQGEAFVIATANDVTSLPPELLRKGRFDEVWWVDLPTRTERLEILGASLKSHGRKLSSLDANRLTDIVTATENFTGAEIAAVIPDALFAAFADNEREIDTDDVLSCVKTVTPLARTAAEKITKLREWASGRARPASASETTVTKSSLARGLDL
jgi:SpoVK/Ycf46/Vps4 family AAA+-type ATPase